MFFPNSTIWAIFSENVGSDNYGSCHFPLYNDGWSSEDKQNALAYMKKLESFEFV